MVSLLPPWLSHHLQAFAPVFFLFFLETDFLKMWIILKVFIELTTLPLFHILNFWSKRYVGILSQVLHLHPQHWKAKSELSDPQEVLLYFQNHSVDLLKTLQGLCALLRGPVDRVEHNDPPRPVASWESLL